MFFEYTMQKTGGKALQCRLYIFTIPSRGGRKMKSKQTVVMASYGMGKFLAEFLTGAYGAIVFYFYENEVGLAAGFAAVATILYSLWNAVNDPIMGFFTNKNAPFSKRFGRRTPWIVIGLLFCAVVFVLIFAVPESWDGRLQPLGVFIWMLLTICLFDAFYSMWEVNYQSLYPDKFRTLEERHRTAAISTVIGVFGVASGFIVPPLFFTYGDRSSYLRCAVILGAITIVGTLLMLPGIKENRKMIERFQKKREMEQALGAAENGFFTMMKKALRHRDFMAFVLLLFFYQSGCICMTGSVNYVVDNILGMSSSATTPIFAGMLVGTLVSIVIWTRLAKRLKNNQKMLMITCVWMAAAAFPMTFVRTQLGYIVFMTLWGIGFGGFWTFMSPAMADVMDAIVVEDGRRDDGVVMGVRAFFMRLCYASQAIVFWATHRFTGFAEDPGSPLAQVGISLHMATIPALFFLFGVLVFAKMNTLTPEKTSQNRERLLALDI
jgi:GPH family glycoside/pentoside/hexuronide:cation symporter